MNDCTCGCPAHAGRLCPFTLECLCRGYVSQLDSESDPFLDCLAGELLFEDEVAAIVAWTQQRKGSRCTQ